MRQKKEIENRSKNKGRVEKKTAEIRVRMVVAVTWCRVEQIRWHYNGNKDTGNRDDDVITAFIMIKVKAVSMLIIEYIDNGFDNHNSKNRDGLFIKWIIKITIMLAKK